MLRLFFIFLVLQYLLSQKKQNKQSVDWGDKKNFMGVQLYNAIYFIICIYRVY